MNVVELSYEDKCTCSNDRFCTFVAQHQDFTPSEVKYLQSVILSKKLSKILYISTTLAVWSMVAAWVDAVILPFLIVYTIALPGATYYPLLFPVIWTILNGTLKFTYIHYLIGNAITLRDNLLAVFPYVGAAFLLKNWFVGDPLLKNASMSYIKSQKERFIQKVVSCVKLK